MLVELIYRKLDGSVETVWAESFNHAATIAADCIQGGETPLSILTDGKVAFDQASVLRMATEACIY